MQLENSVFNQLQDLVLSGKTRQEKWRRKQLHALSDLVENHQQEILNALSKDLKKPPTEAFFEIIAIKQEIKLAQKNLRNWMRSKRINVPVSLKPAQAFIQPDPLGCILIIGPWNYPFSLTLQPLVGALAAGNTAVLKPSEHSPHVSSLIKKLIEKYFQPNIAQVIEGDGNIAADLLTKKFDHVFFTGGERIGKKVMEAAAKNLTPVTLELGGKSPAVVINGANLEVTARRIIWGKSLNAGQTCIAPDHLLVEQNLFDPLITNLKTSINDFYGNTPLNSKHLGSIINQRQFNRLNNLVKQAESNGQIIYGGDCNESEKRISPTLIKIENRDDPLMKEELFGPLLPILCIKSLEEAISDLKLLPKPLALYLFGGRDKDQEKVLSMTSSGGVCFNDVVLQAGIPELPFGGVGSSGMGKYHGKSGFDNFTHYKSILKRPFWLDLNFRYPPYSLDLSLLKKLIG
ncbi:aldehyde dehydrogenase family protein [Prochlorococcus marinus]|uniref:Aldehyde dehydrogenase n=1 Tax=Prochlorococcus marinus XMU1408 TaxID=2213228 RepID=A0A318R583_PROMR|nr:aldehyde dehydrogenase family protein [Prochlorococcus marinus str. XMU1408]PYE03260.1 aldehyde dehydrogenase family protein [Prochlorococcus marinus XMU1408]